MLLALRSAELHLSARMRAHRERLRRLMAMHQKMMGK